MYSLSHSDQNTRHHGEAARTAVCRIQNIWIRREKNLVGREITTRETKASIRCPVILIQHYWITIVSTRAASSTVLPTFVSVTKCVGAAALTNCRHRSTLRGPQ